MGGSLFTMTHNTGPGNLGGFEFTFSSTLTPSQVADMDDFIDSRTLDSEVREPQEENGRTYHAYHAHSYYFPNDPREQERLHHQYRLFKAAMGERLHFAPWTRRNPPRRVLDVATGTGDWAVEFGDAYPTSLVMGTDLSPIQPDEAPPNVHFFVEDNRCEWVFDEPFDYVHSRLTAGSWGDMKAEVVQQAFDNLRPGGWFEAQELDPELHSDDGSLRPDDGFRLWCQEMLAASAAAGRPLTIAPRVRGWVEEVGFVDVREVVIRVPLNGWMGGDPRWRSIGRAWQENLVEGLSGISLALLHRVFGRSPEQIEVELVDARRALADESVHAYQNLHVVWGRKPGPPAPGPWGLNVPS